MLPDPLFLNVHMYGIMIAVGILFAFLVLFRYAKVLKLPPKLTDLVYYDGVVSILLGFGFAALFQATYNYIEHPENGFHLGEGITFLGGIIGGTAVYLIVWMIFRKKVPGSLYDIMPVIPCMITVGHAFGRIGCFFAGCCYGKPTGCVLGVQFPGAYFARLGKVHPTQLYEAAFLFVLFGVLSWLLLKKKFQYTMTVYLASYGVVRFLIEFVRDDDRGKLFGSLSPSQLWSLVFLALAVMVFFLQRRYLKNKPACAEEAPAAEKPAPAPATHTMICPSCGGKFELVGEAAKCPFCGMECVWKAPDTQSPDENGTK